MPDKEHLPQTPEETVAQPGLRFLEFAVYTMGGLLVLMFLGLIFGIVWKITHKTPPVVPVAQQLNLGLAAGAELKSVQADGDYLVVATAGEIVVVDIRKTAVLSRISLGAK